jgi:hypothetical protein
MQAMESEGVYVMMESVANWGYVLFLSLEVEENEG